MSRRWLLLGVVVATATSLGFALGGGLGRDPTVVSSPLINRPAPPLAGRTLDGEQVDLRDFRGNWVLVNVWASWCDACREEHPVLAAAAGDLRPRGPRVLGINTKDRPQAARAFLREFSGPRWPSVIDRDGQIAVTWGTFAIPETYLVNPRGVIVAKAVGPVTQDWVNRRVVPRLEGET